MFLFKQKTISTDCDPPLLDSRRRKKKEGNKRASKEEVKNSFYASVPYLKKKKKKKNINEIYAKSGRKDEGKKVEGTRSVTRDRNSSGKPA